MTELVLHWRLDLINGDYLMVEAPSLMRSRTILAHYREMKVAIATSSFWFEQNQINLDNEIGRDIALLGSTEPYYKAIASLLRPTFNPSALMATSRYRFFVATEPVKHPDFEKPIPGLSGLEQLLGLSHSVKSSNNEGVIITSGDTEIDVMADLLLTFKDQALSLANKYPLQVLVKLVMQANERSQGEEAITRKQQEVDRNNFEKMNDQITAEFQKLGVAGIPF